MFGHSPVAIPLSFENTKYLAIEDKMKILLKICKKALATHELAHTRMIERRKSSFVPFKLGDRVWLDTRNLKTNSDLSTEPP